MRTRTFVVIGAVLLAALTRLMPHPPNFAPITAMALFGASTLKDRRLGIVTPLLALFLSDMCMEIVHRMGLWPNSGIYSGMWYMYLTTFLITLMGLLLRKRRTVATITCATLAGSVVFFVVSNFGVWAFGGLDINGNPYAHTWEGFLYCYEEAIRFFKYTVLGDLVYSTVLFGGFAVATKYWPALRELGSVRNPQEEMA